VDEEISKLVRNVVRCGPEVVKATISHLQHQLAAIYDENEDGKLPHCRLLSHRNNGFYAIDNIFGYASVKIDGDFLRCRSCDLKVASSLQVCTCAWNQEGAHADADSCLFYMIGDRDFLRTRCRNCHGIVGSTEHYPK